MQMEMEVGSVACTVDSLMVAYAGSRQNVSCVVFQKNSLIRLRMGSSYMSHRNTTWPTTCVSHFCMSDSTFLLL